MYTHARAGIIMVVGAPGAATWFETSIIIAKLSALLITHFRQEVTLLSKIRTCSMFIMGSCYYVSALTYIHTCPDLHTSPPIHCFTIHACTFKYVRIDLILYENKLRCMHDRIINHWLSTIIIGHYYCKTMQTRPKAHRPPYEVDGPLNYWSSIQARRSSTELVLSQKFDTKHIIGLLQKGQRKYDVQEQ